MSNLKTTTNHEEIKHWVENRGGKPVKKPQNNSNPGSGPVEFMFPENGSSKEEDYQIITWNEFLEEFENKKLEMTFETQNPDEEQSYFYKLEKRNKDNL